ncbi:ABC-three component system middle component 5 [Mesorhizobium qingshengii]|uniref:ABC-three component system middle component 5 n=1 Tax=Mesorhizobium qingshengii TaxID=1165689 RepID=UPI003B3B18E7
MIYRIWYAHLDIFDTARRYIALLNNWKSDPPSRDRLFISDFYLVSPSLLHLTHMTLDVRREFNLLKIPRPEHCFIKYPAPPVLYNKMAGVQEQALHNIVGKGLLDVSLINKGQLRLSTKGENFAMDMGKKLVIRDEMEIIEFLTSEFVSIGIGKSGLRAVTGLRRLGT